MFQWKFVIENSYKQLSDCIDMKHEGCTEHVLNLIFIISIVRVFHMISRKSNIKFKLSYIHVIQSYDVKV